MSTPEDAVYRLALERALQSCPESSWYPHIGVDYASQRLGRESMRNQLENYVNRPTASIGKAVVRWATTAKWPRLHNCAAFFLREAIRAALARCGNVVVSDTIRETFSGPPWSKDAAQILHAEIVEEWEQGAYDLWISQTVDEEQELQNRMYRSYNEDY
jgi:hypothetical protein